MANMQDVAPGNHPVARRILVMDERREMCSFMRDALRSEPVAVVCRHELLGVDAIKALAPALIIMERSFGASILESWLFLDATRRDPDLASVPVILSIADTGRPSPLVGEELLALGIHLLVQPYSAVDLLSCVRTCLRLGQPRNRLLCVG